ncbi:MAG: hypothetical protein ACKOWN_05525 [Microbacteriaceae bacterium]
MSTIRIPARIIASTKAVIATPLWQSIVIANGVLALVATALTVLSKDANTDGLDGGRMALSFATLLTLAFALFTVPAIVDRIRHTTGASGFLDSFVTAFVVGWSFVFAATPAFLWAILSTGVGPEVWVPALGSLKLEVLVVDLLVAVAFASISRTGTATAVAYAAISSLVIGPLVALAAVTALPGVEQKTTTYMMTWPKDQTEIDEKTGFPKDPKCPTPSTSTQTVPQYDMVWAAAPIIPFALVSESIEPVMAKFIDPLNMEKSVARLMEQPKSKAPIDLFSTIAFTTRSLQVNQSWEVTINECELLAETGNPYPNYPYGPTEAEVIDKTESGFVAGLTGQLAIVGAWITGMLVIPRLRRQK